MHWKISVSAITQQRYLILYCLFGCIADDSVIVLENDERSEQPLVAQAEKSEQPLMAQAEKREQPLVAQAEKSEQPPAVRDDPPVSFLLCSSIFF